MTNFRLDYSYNTAAFNNPASITSLSAFVPVNGGVVNTLSKPQAEWIAEKGWMVWKIGDLQPPSPGMVIVMLAEEGASEATWGPKPLPFRK